MEWKPLCVLFEPEIPRFFFQAAIYILRSGPAATGFPVLRPRLVGRTTGQSVLDTHWLSLFTLGLSPPACRWCKTIMHNAGGLKMRFGFPGDAFCFMAIRSSDAFPPFYHNRESRTSDSRGVVPVRDRPFLPQFPSDPPQRACPPLFRRLALGPSCRRSFRRPIFFREVKGPPTFESDNPREIRNGPKRER